MKLQTNNITGDLHIYLDQYEGDDTDPTRDLIAWFQARSLVLCVGGAFKEFVRLSRNDG